LKDAARRLDLPPELADEWLALWQAATKAGNPVLQRLADRGMPAPLIRQAMRCSMKLVETHLALYQEYNRPEYAWRLELIRNVFHRTEGAKKIAQSNSFWYKWMHINQRRRCCYGYEGVFTLPALREKNLVNAQRSLLRERFDFGRESWLAERLVADFNTQMEAFEATTGIRRVQPGEVLVSYRGEKVTLPLLIPKGAADLVAGKRYAEVSRQMQQTVLSLLRAVDPGATMQDVYRLMAQRQLLPRRGAKGSRSSADVQRTPENAPRGEINPNLLGCHPLVRTDVEGFVLPEVKDSLLRFMCREERRLKSYAPRAMPATITAIIKGFSP